MALNENPLYERNTMSDTPVEMKTISANEIAPNHVFEMFGNLYQVDFVHFNGSGSVEIQAHLIAQLGQRFMFNGRVTIFLSDQTILSVEA